MPFTDPNSFFSAIGATAEKLIAAGFTNEGQALKNALFGSTSGEVLGEAGAWLKRIAHYKNLPAELLPEIRNEIDAIDAAFDRISQPRPAFYPDQKVN